MSDFSDFEGVSDTAVGLLEVSDASVADFTVSNEVIGLTSEDEETVALDV